MKIQFIHYLHDDTSAYERLESLQAQDPRFTEEVVEKMGRFAYEVKLTCEVDTETGYVTFLKVE